MKKLLLTAVIAMTLAHGVHAGLYARGGLMFNSPRDISIKGIASDYNAALDSSAGFNIAVGGKLSIFRVEGEINYFDTNIKDVDVSGVIASGDFRRTSFFANALLEIPFTPIVEPYVGVGIGVSQVKIDFAGLASGGGGSSFTSSADSSQFSYQLMAGLRFSFFEMVSIYGGYRYLNVDGLSFTEGSYQINSKNGAHIWEIGVGIGF